MHLFCNYFIIIICKVHTKKKVGFNDYVLCNFYSFFALLKKNKIKGHGGGLDHLVVNSKVSLK
jgi:hypothetical protein